MSIQYSREIQGVNENILAVPDHFTNVPVKVNLTNVTAGEDGKKILKAGTILSKDGKIVDGTTITDDKAFGLVYREVDFTNAVGTTHTVPVTIHGFINGSKLPKSPSATALGAMKQITIL